MKKITIAIDGYSSCGKSTMAKSLAKKLGYVYVDTGAMYRSVTLFAIRHQLFNEDGSVKTDELQRLMPEIHISFKLNKETGLPETYLNGELVEREIRGMEVSSHVSPIAAIPFVREALVKQQQAMGHEKGVEVRAQRRYDELQAKGQPADYADILKNVQQRDYIDTHRETSPLRQAPDALVLDNSHMTIAEQDEWLMKRVLNVKC